MGRQVYEEKIWLKPSSFIKSEYYNADLRRYDRAVNLTINSEIGSPGLRITVRIFHAHPTTNPTIKALFFFNIVLIIFFSPSLLILFIIHLRSRRRAVEYSVRVCSSFLIDYNLFGTRQTVKSEMSFFVKNILPQTHDIIRYVALVYTTVRVYVYIYLQRIWRVEFSTFWMTFTGVDRKNLVPGDGEIAPRKFGLLFNNNNNNLWTQNDVSVVFFPSQTSLYTQPYNIKTGSLTP